jgi:hypothetical protein
LKNKYTISHAFRTKYENSINEVTQAQPLAIVTQKIIYMNSCYFIDKYERQIKDVTEAPPQALLIRKT